MKTSYKCILAIVALGMWSSANATPITGQISIGGFASAVGAVGMGSATGIDFASGSGDTISGNSGDLYSFGGGTGSFAGISCVNSSGTCGTIDDIASFATFGSTTGFLTFNTGGPSISFDLANITAVSHNSSSNSVTFTANGTIDFSGDDPTPGTLILIAQGDNVVSFSGTLLATTVATPEPSSLVLLGGSLAALGLIRRKNMPWRR